MSEMTNTCGKLNVLIPFWQGVAGIYGHTAAHII